MLVLTLQADDRYKKLLPPKTLKRINALLTRHLKFDKKNAEATVTFVSPNAIQELNHDFRGKKKPTNVLSFPQFTPQELKRLTHGAIYLGDIILCKKIIVAEALKQKKPLNHHLIHLVVHGTLHLLGYDHMTSKDARKMEKLETLMLAELGIPDPYVIDLPN